MSIALQPLSVGETVKFAAPLTDDERVERFTVIELRGHRVLVEYICDMRLKPQSVYFVADLIPCNE
jgi:hypothetical protein